MESQVGFEPTPIKARGFADRGVNHFATATYKTLTRFLLTTTTTSAEVSVTLDFVQQSDY